MEDPSAAKTEFVLTSDTVSAILRRVTTTAKRRRAMDETVTLFSMSDGLAPVSIFSLSN